MWERHADLHAQGCDADLVSTGTGHGKGWPVTGACTWDTTSAAVSESCAGIQGSRIRSALPHNRTAMPSISPLVRALCLPGLAEPL